MLDALLGGEKSAAVVGEVSALFLAAPFAFAFGFLGGGLGFDLPLKTQSRFWKKN